MHSLRLCIENVTYGSEASDEISSRVSKILIHQILNPGTRNRSEGGSSKSRLCSSDQASEHTGGEPTRQRGTPC